MAPPLVAAALKLILTEPRILKLLAIAAALLLLLPIVIVVIGGVIVMGALQSVFGWFDNDLNAAIRPVDPVMAIPDDFKPIYAEAERVFEVNRFLLASVHYQETAFNNAPTTFTINPSGCAGPMQIGLRGACGCTWCDGEVRDAHQRGNRPPGYRGAHGPHPSVYDTFDAVMGGAVWLRRKVGGAPIPRLDGHARQALCGYYGACADGSANYADEVLDRARMYQLGGNTDPAPGGTLAWPVPRDAVVTSPFCDDRRSWNGDPCHRGVDFDRRHRDPIFAAGAGRVTTATWVGGYGLLVCIEHTPAVSTCYGHLDGFAVQSGDSVTKGQVIGYAGTTGYSTGTHLHFEVRVNGKRTCPAVYTGAPELLWCAPGWRQRSSVL